MNEEPDDAKKATEECGPGCRCSCASRDGGSRKKWIICGVVALAAVVVIAARVSRTQAANGQAKQGYAVTIPATGAPDAEKSAVADSNAWGVPLTALAELNVVASNTEAVFIVVPSSDAERTAAIQKEVATAAATITARGSRMGTFLLSKDAQEYGALVQQVGTPAVVAMCKGRGMAVVKDKDVTQDGLLKAFVGASRPSSGCCPGGAGTSGCQ